MTPLEQSLRRSCAPYMPLQAGEVAELRRPSTAWRLLRETMALISVMAACAVVIAVAARLNP